MLKCLEPTRLRIDSRWCYKTQPWCVVTGAVSLPQPTAVPSSRLLPSFRSAKFHIVTIVQDRRETEAWILLTPSTLNVFILHSRFKGVSGLSCHPLVYVFTETHNLIFVHLSLLSSPNTISTRQLKSTMIKTLLRLDWKMRFLTLVPL